MRAIKQSQNESLLGTKKVNGSDSKRSVKKRPKQSRVNLFC